MTINQPLTELILKKSWWKEKKNRELYVTVSLSKNLLVEIILAKMLLSPEVDAETSKITPSPIFGELKVHDSVRR